MDFVDIQKLPTAENSALRLSPADNVAVARVPLAAGAGITVAGNQVVLRDAIPAGHKLALAAVARGEFVRRYGEVIGRAKQDILPGEHVDMHNLGFEEVALDYEFPEREVPIPDPPSSIPCFMGYARPDGRAGTRNYIAVVAASNCAAHTAELIARSFEGYALPTSVDGVVAFPHGEGCGMSSGPDLTQLQRTLAGVLVHPNVGAALVLGLGCEVNQIDHYLGKAAPQTGRLAGLTLQSSGGTRGTVDAGRREVLRMIDEQAGAGRTSIPASKIVLGLNCGGSDSFSGITANPALGVCSDLLAGIGATAVLAETTEVFGAEHWLVRRARNRRVAEKLLGYIEWYKAYLRQFQGSFNDNPSPGNKEGGLTNIVEKSLGAVAKAGSSPLMDAIGYAEPIVSPGMVFMNTPGYDPPSLAGLVAGGCNLIAFTTGRGSAIGFPSVPVVKIASNSNTYRRMAENMDVNAGRIADGDSTVEAVGREIFDLLLRVASGEKTSSETHGHTEFVPWRIGPVM